MRVDLEMCLLEEASRVVGRDMNRDDVLHRHFNINRLLTFVQFVYRRTGVELDVNTFFIWPTIGAFCDACNGRAPASPPKMMLLKEGDVSRPLVVFAGGVNCFLEIKSILNGFDHDGAVYGMCLSDFGRPHSNPATLADEVDACLEELARQKVVDPLSLVGYSFGGLVALELARKMSERGQDICFLGLIDTQQSEHTWPLAVWSRHVFRRFARKLKRDSIAFFQKRQPAGSAVPGAQTVSQRTILHRLRPVLFRFCSPTLEVYPELTPDYVAGLPPTYESMGKQVLRMQGLYRPKPYQGKLVYYKAQGGSPIQCDPKHIWELHLPNAEWVEVRGNHLSAIVGRNGLALGRDISRRIVEPTMPTPNFQPVYGVTSRI